MKNESSFIKKYAVSKWLYLKSFFVSDEKYIKAKFLNTFGYELDLKDPKTLNEKMQWLKLNYHPKMFEVFADKYEVREYVRNVIGDEYLIPVNMTLDSPEKLSTDILPDTPFIIKTNHDCSGGIIVRDKREVDIDYAKRWCKFNLSNNHFYASRERHYKNLSRRIIIEKLLLTKENKIPNDYKINCINGEPQFIYCAIDREGENYRKIYDVNWSELDFKWGSRDVINNKFNGKNIPVPNNLDEMLKISRQLSRGYKYLRVDLYDVDGKLYVGELTMYHGAGFDIIEPKEIDEYYGSMINVNKE